MLAPTAGQDGKKPNILWLLSDQHNSRFLGSSGDRPIDTPHLDRLSSEGMRFDNAYCQNPVCSPSRASMLTGMYSKHCGVYGNRHILEHNCPTVARSLADAGYRTCLIGKAHFNGEQFHGFQQRPYGDLYGQAHQPDPKRTPDMGPNGLGGVLSNSGPSAIPLPLTQTEICVAEAAKWLQTHVGSRSNQPFFLKVSFDKPHFPMKPPAAYFSKYAGNVRLPEYSAGDLAKSVSFVQQMVRTNPIGEHYGKDADIQLRALAAYCGCIEWIDSAVGRLLDTLDYVGLAEHTIVMYSSDHGEMAGEKGIWQKTLFFDDSARVPLLVRWPGAVRAGSVCSHPVGLVDLFPALCEAAGAAVPDTCDGVSLMPLWTETGGIGRDAMFAESVVLDHPEYAGCMIRTGDWKYNAYLDGQSELYHLPSDPREKVNRTDDPDVQSVKRTLHERLMAFWEPDKQLERYERMPMMRAQKDQYRYSNQFVLGDGTIVDGRP